MRKLTLHLPCLMARLASLLLLGAPVLAFSGHWTTTYVGGQCVFKYGTILYSLGSSGWGAGCTSNSWTSPTTASGAITATLHWNPDYPGELAPQTNFVMEKSGVGATSRGTPVGAVSSDDGIGDSSTYGSNQTSASSGFSGTLISYHITGGAENVQLAPRSPSASATQLHGDASVFVTYSATAVTKAVSIQCSVDPSYHKDPSTELPVLNNPNQDIVTPIWGDTWVDPSTAFYDMNNDEYFELTPTFTCDPIGYWSSSLYHSWNAAGIPFSDVGLIKYNSISPYWSISAVDLTDMGSFGPKTYEVDLTLTDNGQNGASAQATYYLRVHNEYDHWVPDGDVGQLTVFPYVTAQSPGFCNQGCGIACTYTEDDALWSDLVRAISPAIPIGALVFQNPLYKAAFLAASVTLAQATPQTKNATPNFDACWGEPNSTISGSWSDPKNLYNMYPFVIETYSSLAQKGDHYGPNGYTGHVPNVVEKLIGVQWVGNFVRM